MKSDKTFAPERRKFIKNSAALAGSGLIMASIPSISFSQNESSNKIVTGTCLLTPEEVSGPYFRNVKLMRKNIVENESGLPLLLKLRVIEKNSCAPLENMFVDIWHCNSRGAYSGWSHINPDLEAEPNNVGQIAKTDDKTFLRGSQQSNADGYVRFISIYPGFYAGRATHIHVAIRAASKDPNEKSHFAFIGQLYLPESLNEMVYKRDEYSHRKLKRLLGEDDELYNKYHGELSILHVRNIVSDSIDDGIIANIDLAIDSNHVSEYLTKDDLYAFTV